MITVLEADPEEVFVITTPLECNYSLKAPIVESEVVYKSGSNSLMFSWPKFELTELTDNADCIKQADLQVKISETHQNDRRFNTTTDWLHYTKSTIGNKN